MMGSFDRAGKRINLREFGRLAGDPKYKRVAATTISDDLWVSTVWVGLDHCLGDGAPLIFETMVFGPDSWTDLFCERYSTEAEAYAGHERVVAALRDGKLPDGAA